MYGPRPVDPHAGKLGRDIATVIGVALAAFLLFWMMVEPAFNKTPHPTPASSAPPR